MDAHDHDDEEMFDRHDHAEADAGRTTSPMQSFTSQQATIGLLVLVVGLVVVFGLPLLAV